MFYWIWQLSVTAVLIAAGLAYIRGWRKLQQYPLSNSRAFRRATHRALLRFFLGLTLTAIALVSPVHTLAGQYFSIRVLQIMLLIGSVPSLLLSTNPVPILYQGLPTAWRRRAQQKHPLPATPREGLRLLTGPGAAFIAFVAAYWLSFDPALHQASVRYPPLRGLMELALLGAALLYWWHITGALPRLHAPLPLIVRAIYTFIGVAVIKLVGLVVMFSTDEFYSYPETFQLSGLEINDYFMGGILFWVLGGIVYAITGLLLLRSWLSQEESKPGLPESAWATEESMLAPGIKK